VRPTANGGPGFKFTLRKNGVAVAGGGFRQVFGTSTDWQGIAFHKVVTLSSGDYLSMFASAVSSTSITLYVSNLNLVAVGKA
jgi:hypothetical protein